jgi:hypothetical protein
MCNVVTFTLIVPLLGLSNDAKPPIYVYYQVLVIFWRGPKYFSKNWTYSYFKELFPNCFTKLRRIFEFVKSSSKICFFFGDVINKYHYFLEKSNYFNKNSKIFFNCGVVSIISSNEKYLQEVCS